MQAFSVAPHSAFRGASVRRSLNTPTCGHGCRRTLRILAVAPMEERRAAEIERMAKQLAQLKAQKAALEAQKRRASKEPEPWPSESPRPPAPVQAQALAGTEDSGPVLQRLGKHGEKSHFCGISTLEGHEYAPRILPVVGTIPGVSLKAFEDIPDLNSTGRELGCIAWSSVPAGFAGELVAINCPTQDLGKASLLVAARVDISHIAPEFISGNIGDALALIDCSKSAKMFDSLKFYAWGIGGQVHIGWLQSKPPPEDAICLGRVLGVMLEEDKERVKARSCWKEEDEVW